MPQLYGDNENEEQKSRYADQGADIVEEELEQEADPVTEDM